MGEPRRTDVRFDFVDQLPPAVPPVEKQPTSLFPYPPPVGPGEATYYFPVYRASCNPTGVFFPFGYTFPSTINVILYFHGFKLGRFKHIDGYWKGDMDVWLREDINRSGKPVVLIAPTLGAKPGSENIADMGVFASGPGADDFLAEVARWIGRYVPQYANKPSPKIGKVAIAGHSGAGVILNTLARDMRTLPCEVWGFDSTYGQSTNLHKKLNAPDVDVAAGWIDVARARSSTKFFFHWSTKSPGRHALDLKALAAKAGLKNVAVEQTGTGAIDDVGSGLKLHFDSVAKNFGKRVRDASCF